MVSGVCSFVKYTLHKLHKGTITSIPLKFGCDTLIFPLVAICVKVFLAMTPKALT